MEYYTPSNTDTPPMYALFRKKVLSGELPVCIQISQEMNRIDARIKDPSLYYDRRPPAAFIRFCEGELTKTDGTEIQMLDSFKLWSEQLFGWHYYASKSIYVPNPNGIGGEFISIWYLKRLISKQYLIVARGAAKSMYISFIQAYFLIVNGETTQQITVAPTMIQAEEVLGPIRTALVRSPGPVLKFLTAKTTSLMDNSNRGAAPLVLATKKGIESRITSSLLAIRPMQVDKLQGLRPMISTIDEWLSGDVRENVISAVEQGAAKLDDYIIVAVSSEGTIRHGTGDDIKYELSKILNGEYDDPHTSIFYYRLDDVAEVADPDMWIKAQPNLGLTVTYETYHRDVIRAENAPSSRNDILAKRFGIPMEGFTWFFTYEETLVHPKRTYNKMVCSLGADLSQGDDFCSFTFLFPLRSRGFGVKTINYITDRTLNGLTPTARMKYDTFMKEDSLIILEGSVLNMEVVYRSLIEEIERLQYEVLCFGFDPYNAESFVKLWTEEHGPFAVETVRQGVRTESVPLGELKTYSEDRLLLFDQEIMEYAMGNAMVMVDNNGGRKLFKRRYADKIDCVSALMDAYVAYGRHTDLFS